MGEKKQTLKPYRTACNCFNTPLEHIMVLSSEDLLSQLLAPLRLNHPFPHPVDAGCQQSMFPRSPIRLCSTAPING